MNLTKLLRNQGFDLIDGPVRGYKPLQVWSKKPFNEVSFYAKHLKEIILNDEVVLNEVKSPVMDINSSVHNEFSFNIGLSVLEDVLKGTDIGDLGLKNNIKGGKSVTISYDNAFVEEYTQHNLEQYIHKGDIGEGDVPLLKQLNDNNLLLISGVIYAKNMTVDIDSKLNFDSELVLKLNKIADGKVTFNNSNSKSIKMTTELTEALPIAVKAYRIVFFRSQFKKIELITDNKVFLNDVF